MAPEFPAAHSPGWAKSQGLRTNKRTTKEWSRTQSSINKPIHVTLDGIALSLGRNFPKGLVENPHRPGSYGNYVNGKFKEKLRIDPATPPGKKGPNHSHYHKDGKGKHYSPRPGDQDPGFGD